MKLVKLISIETRKSGFAYLYGKQLHELHGSASSASPASYSSYSIRRVQPVSPVLAKRVKRLGRPMIDAKTEVRIRQFRDKGHGILRIDRELGIGASTVQRVLAN